MKERSAMKTVYDVIVCPVCGGRLEPVGGSLLCFGAERRHTFDRASSGYVNLLPPGRKSNAGSGDRRDLVRARTDFLNTGKYDPVSDAVASFALRVAEGRECFVLADFGCGEGYHTCRVAEALRSRGVPAVAVGFDASKYAVETGAKRASRLGIDDTLSFFAGNYFHPPVAPSSVSCVVTMFAPVAYGAAEAILEKDGAMITVVPGPDHLIELRRLLYREVEVRSGDPAIPDPFFVADRVRIRYGTDLSDAEAASLFGMTPFFCRAPAEARERVLSAGGMTVTVDVNVLLIEKRPEENK